jgi:hypothetical protein
MNDKVEGKVIHKIIAECLALHIHYYKYYLQNLCIIIRLLNNSTDQCLSSNKKRFFLFSEELVYIYCTRQGIE